MRFYNCLRLVIEMWIKLSSWCKMERMAMRRTWWRHLNNCRMCSVGLDISQRLWTYWRQRIKLCHAMRLYMSWSLVLLSSWRTLTSQSFIIKKLRKSNRKLVVIIIRILDWLIIVSVFNKQIISILRWRLSTVVSHWQRIQDTQTLWSIWVSSIEIRMRDSTPKRCLQPLLKPTHRT